MGTWEWMIPEGRIEWSEGHYALLGYEAHSVAPSYRAFRRRLHPDDVRGQIEEMRAAARERRDYEAEYRVVWPNGETHWVQARGRFKYGSDGRPVRMFGVIADIDRQKRAERAAQEADAEKLRVAAQLRRIAEATPGVIFSLRRAPDGRISMPYSAPHMHEVYGIGPGDVREDASVLYERVHPEDRPRTVELMEASMRNSSMWHAQFRYLHPEKGEIWLEAFSTPMQEPDGSCVWHGIVHDITELKQAEMELREARRRAEAADRAKSEFLANMSHEIRTPMSAILGYAEILSAQLVDPDDLQSLDTIRSSGRYLLEIIDDILDLSRIEAGRLEIVRQRVRPDMLVLEVQSLMKLRAAEKGLRLEVEFEGELPETVETDPTRLRQILINLIENAVKFTERGEVRVALRLIAAESCLEIEVVDTGIGIPEQTLHRLFKPFSQGDSSVTRRFGGSGLGLSISKALARMLGGDIEVTSAEGRGTRFRLTIATGSLLGVPLFDPKRTQLPAAARREALRSLHCRVLVVDDRREMRHLAQHMLEEAGAEVVCAVDGAKALDEVEAARGSGRHFDAIVLDMQMPVLDGYAAARELRRRGYEGPVIALTANAMKEDERKCLECGCDDYLSKPLERETLVNTVARYTEDMDRKALAARRAERPSANAAGACRILLVEDNADAGTLMRLLMEKAGHEVVMAADGRAALEAAAGDAAFDVVVLDLGLPHMSGGEVLRALTRRSPFAGARFICLSGRRESEVDWRGLGFDHYLEKPVAFEELRGLLRPRAENS